jgi:GNAT superfamily N-acetyltransferase
VRRSTLRLKRNNRTHLGANIGITAVLHTWGSAMTHHPHVHMIVPGGGISLDGSRWITKRPDFLLPVRVLSKLFRRLMIQKLIAAHAAGRLTFHGAHAALVNTKKFTAYLAPLKRTRWYVHAKRPLAGPEAVLAYLSRYTHRVAISNRRLIAADAKTVTFKVKDYRIEGPERYKTMTLEAYEFIHIHEMSVSETFQGHGIGRALLEAAIEWAVIHHFAALTLTTFREVPWNATFYSQCGFEVLSVSGLDERLSGLLREEVEEGFAEGTRCAMRFSLDDPSNQSRFPAFGNRCRSQHVHAKT